MDEHHDNRKLVEDITKIWDMAPDEVFDVQTGEAWEYFRKNRMHKDRGSVTQIKSHSTPAYHTSKRKTVDGWAYLFRAAAVLLIAVLAGYFVHTYYTDNLTTHDQEGIPTVMKELVTGNGERSQVTFSDGTKIILNASSSLSFPRQLSRARSEVYLEGEAYFKVPSGSDRLFIVHTQDVEVRVLGTEFNVRNWKDDPGVEVVVREGRVSVLATNEELEGRREVTIDAGYHTEVNRNQAPSIPRKVDIRNNLVWVNGGLHFDNRPFRLVIRDLERRFDVRISVRDEKILDVTYTGIFQHGELNEILAVIAAAMETEYRRVGSDIEFL